MRYGLFVDTKRFEFLTFRWTYEHVKGQLRQKYKRHLQDINVTRGKTLSDFIMSPLLRSKTDIIFLKLFFGHNVRYGNSVTFRIWVALESLQYLDNHEPQRYDFSTECTPTDRTCQLYYHYVRIMMIYEQTNNLVSGAFLKCFSTSFTRTLCACLGNKELLLLI